MSFCLQLLVTFANIVGAFGRAHSAGGGEAPLLRTNGGAAHLCPEHPPSLVHHYVPLLVRLESFQKYMLTNLEEDMYTDMELFAFDFNIILVERQNILSG